MNLYLRRTVLAAKQRQKFHSGRFCVIVKKKTLLWTYTKLIQVSLTKFYLGFTLKLAKKTEVYIKKTSMHALRYGLQRKIKYIRDVNIIDGTECKRSNEVFTAQLVHLKKIGFAKIDHKPPLSQHDLALLYTSGVFAINTPSSLQKRVFFSVIL